MFHFLNVEVARERKAITDNSCQMLSASPAEPSINRTIEKNIACYFHLFLQKFVQNFTCFNKIGKFFFVNTLIIFVLRVELVLT